MEKCPQNHQKKAFKNKAWFRQAAKDKSNQSAFEDEESTRLPYPLTTHFAAQNFFFLTLTRRRREEKVTSAKSFFLIRRHLTKAELRTSYPTKSRASQ